MGLNVSFSGYSDKLPVFVGEAQKSFSFVLSVKFSETIASNFSSFSLSFGAQIDFMTWAAPECRW